MDDSVRTLRWVDGIFKFPCGVKFEMTKDQVVKLLTQFRLDDQIDNMVNNGAMTISKGRAFQIKSHLTMPRQ